MVELSKYSTSSRIALKMMTGNVIISELDALMYVVVSRENQALWGNN
jgi:hypothetical protein